MKPETWLKRAISRKTAKPPRPELQQIHGLGDYSIASDGHRIHLYHANLGYAAVPNFPKNVLKVWPTNFEIHARVTSKHLQMIAENAMVIGNTLEDRLIGPVLRLGFETIALHTELWGQDCAHRSILVDGGEWLLGKKARSSTAVYKAEGGTGEFYLQPKYLKDAIWGMAEEIDLWVCLGDKKLLIKSEASKKLEHPCEAIIMGVRNPTGG